MTEQTKVDIGARAPYFSLPDSEGTEWQLSKRLRRRVVGVRELQRKDGPWGCSGTWFFAVFLPPTSLAQSSNAAIIADIESARRNLEWLRTSNVPIAVRNGRRFPLLHFRMNLVNASQLKSANHVGASGCRSRVKSSIIMVWIFPIQTHRTSSSTILKATSLVRRLR